VAIYCFYSSFVLTQKKQKVKTKNSFRAKSTATNRLRDPSRQGKLSFFLSLHFYSIALPSGSLRRPLHMVHCLVLLRKEFKVDPKRPRRLLRGSAL
jgi:hypothetical protein